MATRKLSSDRDREHPDDDRSVAATSAPKASTSTASVSGSARSSPRRVVFRADRADVVVERRIPVTLTFEPLRPRQSRHRLAHVSRRSGDNRAARRSARRRQGSDQKRGLTVGADDVYSPMLRTEMT